MNQWTFVVAAYAVAALGVLALVVGSFWSMRRAEEEADRLSRASASIAAERIE